MMRTMWHHTFCLRLETIICILLSHINGRKMCNNVLIHIVLKTFMPSAIFDTRYYWCLLSKRYYTMTVVTMYSILCKRKQIYWLQKHSVHCTLRFDYYQNDLTSDIEAAIIAYTYNYIMLYIILYVYLKSKIKSKIFIFNLPNIIPIIYFKNTII